MYKYFAQNKNFIHTGYTCSWFWTLYFDENCWDATVRWITPRSNERQSFVYRRIEQPGVCIDL